MAIRPIIYADNPRLRQKSRQVKVFGSALKTLVDDMFETMDNANGLGLAAPQVDVHERVIVIRIPEDKEDEENQKDPQSGQTYILINPEVVRADGEEEGQEGCLSIPGWWGLVTRAAFVTVKAQNVKGKPFRLKAEGLLARALQHEIDHLSGVLFIDRVESSDKLFQIKSEEETDEEESEYVLAAG